MRDTLFGDPRARYYPGRMQIVFPPPGCLTLALSCLASSEIRQGPPALLETSRLSREVLALMEVAPVKLQNLLH